MIRNFKALGLMAMALLAMSAVVASAASATNGTLTSEGQNVAISGAQEGTHEFVLTDNSNLKTTCKKATFTAVGLTAEGATTTKAHPVYEECTAFGLPSTITTTGCDYEFHITTPTATGGWHVDTDVVCGGGAISITTLTCELKVDSQTGLTTSEVTNSGGPGKEMDLLLHTKVHSIKYTVTKDGIGCPLSGTGTFNSGDYNGTTTIKGVNGSGQPVGITVH